MIRLDLALKDTRYGTGTTPDTDPSLDRVGGAGGVRVVRLPAAAAATVVANTNDAGAGSLRAAITAATAGDTLNLSSLSSLSSLSGSIVLSSGEMLITKDLTITGPGAGSLSIDGNLASRVFSIDSGKTLTISDVTITGGNGVGATNSGNGGAFYNAGTLTMSASTLSRNVSSGAAGIYNFFGTVGLTSVTLRDNTTTFDGTGIHNVTGSVTITTSTISGNNGRNGGWIKNQSSGDVTITDSTISGNTAEFGGAINNDATLNITRSTIMHNTGTQGGAGIFSNTGTITIINSTFSSNHATGSASGGALYSSQATTNFTNSTVVSNTAAGSGSGIRTDGSGTTTFVNTIIANNPGDDCFGAGTYTSNDYNLDSDNTCNLTGSNDITSTDPLLGSLANNGGPTLTHKPATTSPVVNAGKDSAAPVTDQRGTARPSGAQSDIGSVEIIVILTGVPSLTTWGLLALAAMLGAGVLYGRRRVSAT